jgi:hypothetical protein
MSRYRNTHRVVMSRYGNSLTLSCLTLQSYANVGNFQLIHDENKLHFDEMMMMSALYKTNTFNWIFIVLVQWNNSRSTRAHYPVSEIASLCSYSLLLRA